MSKYLIFIITFLLVRLGTAQSDVYKFSHITDADGLSQNSVVAIHQDRLGQIWIGTRDGLNKYDGEEFKLYRHKKDNPSSISNNGILCIEEDKNGFIWVGTSFGLNRYDPKKNAFQTYFINRNGNFLGSNMIKVVKQMSNQEIWIGSSNGISIYDEKKDTFQPILEKNNIISILETRVSSTLLILMLDEIMNIDKPFLEKDFRLAHLSSALNVPDHHLASCLRNIKETTFTDLKNSYRVEFFKSRVKNGDLKHLTVDALREECGFRSKSSFYSAFNKYEGTTPSEYISKISSVLEN